MNQSNLSSPTGIRVKCNLTDLDGWLNEELKAIPKKSERKIIKMVIKNLDDFIMFPKKAKLMWERCDRVPEKGKLKYHKFPKELKDQLKESGITTTDSRPNGPAIAAFRFGGGDRPNRYGSNNSWHIHHLYSGKFPYLGKEKTLHAVKNGLHFTQSAGLIATHPIADQMCDEYPFFSWYLRAIAFQKFGYDPDEVFSPKKHNKYGFINKQ